MKLTNSVKNLDAKLLETEPSKSLLQILYEQFSNYLLHGGYLTAMNDLAKDGEIAKATLDTYADWIRGDVIKHGKSDHHCREFFTAMIKRLNSQITWTALAKDFAIEHHGTIVEYAELLQSMDAIFIQQALLEDKLTGAAKKARKLMFTDPFIYHAIYSWLNPCRNLTKNNCSPVLTIPKLPHIWLKQVLPTTITATMTPTTSKQRGRLILPIPIRINFGLLK